ncbi:hypothetical protein D3C81_1478570 [compost metagenome]
MKPLLACKRASTAYMTNTAMSKSVQIFHSLLASFDVVGADRALKITFLIQQYARNIRIQQLLEIGVGVIRQYDYDTVDSTYFAMLKISAFFAADIL